jgi:peroxiredoxin
MMTRYSLVVLGLLVLGCDGGGGGAGEDVAAGEPETNQGTGPVTPECTKNTVCEWGELCIEKSCQVPEGAGGAPAYDFSAQDQCPGSKSYQQMVTLSDCHGSVVLLYFATSTCAACIADVKVYENMVKQLEYKGYVGKAKMITVLLPFSGSAIADFAQGLQFPVVLDDTTIGIADHYGASKDTVVLIDGAGYVREKWPTLEVRGGAKDKTLLSGKLTELVEELM